MMSRDSNENTSRLIPSWAMFALAWGVLTLVLQAPIGWPWIQGSLIPEFIYALGNIPKVYFAFCVRPGAFESDSRRRLAVFLHWAALQIWPLMILLWGWAGSSRSLSGIIFITDALFTIVVTLVVVKTLNQTRYAAD